MNIRDEELKPYLNPPKEHRVRGLMCGDRGGQMQVIAPESAIVDPEPIRATTAREVACIPEDHTRGTSAVPGFYGLPSVVDKTIKSQPLIALATETPGEYLQATGRQIEQLCLDHVSFETEFSQNLVHTPNSRDNDEQNILCAVESFTSRRIEARLEETLHIPPLPEARPANYGIKVRSQLQSPGSGADHRNRCTYFCAHYGLGKFSLLWQ